MQNNGPDGGDLPSHEEERCRIYPMPRSVKKSCADALTPVRVYYRTEGDEWSELDVPTYLRKKLFESMSEDSDNTTTWHRIG